MMVSLPQKPETEERIENAISAPTRVSRGRNRVGLIASGYGRRDRTGPGSGDGADGCGGNRTRSRRGDGTCFGSGDGAAFCVCTNANSESKKSGERN